MVDLLNPVFFSTPALAFGRCYDVLMEVYQLTRTNINRAFAVVTAYDEATVAQINEDEDNIDIITDRTSNYLIHLSAHITSPDHVEIMNHYYTISNEFERLGDHAMNIAEIATAMNDTQTVFSRAAQAELTVLRELLDTILDYSCDAFQNRNLTAARHIEPLEEVVDDMVGVLRDNHLQRLRDGQCTNFAGTEFLNLLSEAERISDVCSNIGVATVARIQPELKHQVHNYVSMLHSGRDEAFNREYEEAHDRYFRLLSGTKASANA